jgi:hypothetical protein
MSRTHNTDPYLIQGYRAQGRKVHPDWRARWKNYPRNGARPYFDPADVARWWAEYPDHGKSWMYGKRSSSVEDRRYLQKHLRQRTRQAIIHEDYDADLRPDDFQGWLFYTY